MNVERQLIEANIKINRNKHKSIKMFYSSLKATSFCSLFLVVAVLFALIIYIFIEGSGKITFDFLFGTEEFSLSLMPAFVGTVSVIIIACLVAIPIGIATAIFLAEYTNSKSKIVKFIRVSTETLAGIPSIVYGLFGYILFVQKLKLGYTILGGGLTIAIMILPLIVRNTEESLLSVPQSYRDGPYALGASKVRTIFKVILPSASSGIVTAVILAIGRVISESAVLLLTIGGLDYRIPQSLLVPGTTLALNVYYYGSHGYPNEAAATALILLVFILLINALAMILGYLLRRKHSAPTVSIRVRLKHFSDDFKEKFNEIRLRKSKRI